MLNLDRELLYENEIAVATEIADWLLTLPEFKDLEYYLSKVPDVNQEPYVDYAAKLALENLSEQKQQYFIQIGAEDFVKQLSEVDQIHYLLAFSQYAAESVVRNIGESYPQLATLQIPATIFQWAGDFINKLDTILDWCTLPAFLNRRFYLEELRKSFHDFTQLQEIALQLEEALRNISIRYQSNAELTPEDRAKEKNLLRQLIFIPEESWESILDYNDQPEKVELFTSISRAAQVLLIFREQVLTLQEVNPAAAEGIMGEALRLEIKPQLVAKLETLRVLQYPVQLPGSDYIQKLSQIWSLESINAGTAAQQTQQLALQIKDPNQQATFTKALYSVIRASSIITLAIDPYSLDFIFNMLSGVNDPIQLPLQVREMSEQLEKPLFRPVFTQLLPQLHTILHTFKQQ
jgi:hypothetical protein